MSEVDLWKRERLLYISWEKLGTFLAGMHHQLIDSHYEPTCIIGLHRGGLIPATYFSNVLNLPNYKILRVMRNLSNSRYSERAEPIFEWMAPDSIMKGERVLLVDDISGDGGTLSRALNEIYRFEPTSVKTAVVVKNIHSRIEPDYLAISVDDWVVFPWEVLQRKEEQAWEYL